ncbi:MAG: alpha/beta hydrolase [Acidobacteria bacterium]|nr:alpha/beta hydrolase [Acidobacteriota bacterium]
MRGRSRFASRRVLNSAALLVLVLGLRGEAASPPPADPLPGEEILLWPGDAPGSEGLPLDRVVTERSRDPELHDRIVTRIRRPRLRAVRPAEPNGTAVVVVPGGAYQRVVVDKEGFDVAEWLNGLGVTAFVLEYRLPAEGHANPSDVPLEDAQRALRLLRSRAKELGIDPSRIGVLGFSAGGHLAGALAAYHDAQVYQPADAADRESARPDFAVLIYPVVHADWVSPAVLEAPGLRQVVEKYPLVPRASESGDLDAWPPTFLVQTADDPSVRVEGALRLFAALHSAGIPAEIHVFQTGGHGFGIRNAEGPVARWPALCGEWLRGLGVIGAP